MASIEFNTVPPRDIFVPMPGTKKSYMILTSGVARGDRADILTAHRILEPNLLVGRLADSVTKETLGYAFRSEGLVINYGTGLIVSAPGWLASKDPAKGIDFTKEKIDIFIRNEDLIAAGVTGKLIAITGTQVSEKLHSFLTMI